MSDTPDPGLRVWLCHYSWSGRFQTYEDIYCVVVAEIESKAIGMAAMENPETKPRYWSADEISLTEEGVHFVTSFSS